MRSTQAQTLIRVRCRVRMQVQGHIVATLNYWVREQPSMNELTLSKIGWVVRHKLEIS